MAVLGCLVVAALPACGRHADDDMRGREGPSSGTETVDSTDKGDASHSQSEEFGPEMELGRRWLRAVQDNDIDAYLSCWLQIEDIEALVDNPPDDFPVPSESELDEMRGYFTRRTNFTRASFPLLRKALEGEADDLSQLTIQDVLPIGELPADGPWQASCVQIILQNAEGRRLEYDIDDGVFLNERWYFSDRPSNTLEVSTDKGKTEWIGIGEYATPEELEECLRWEE